jgi:hypothetical protein
MPAMTAPPARETARRTLAREPAGVGGSRCDDRKPGERPHGDRWGRSVSVSTRVRSRASTMPANAAAHETMVGGFASVAASESRRADPKLFSAGEPSAALFAECAILTPTTTSAAPPTS